MTTEHDQADPTGGALDGIAGEAAMLEGQQEQQQQQATAQPENPMGGAMGWAMIAKGVGSCLAVALPEVADAYSDQACMAWGEAMDALAQKYGWEGGASRFGPEIAVAFASVGLVVPVVKAVKHRKMIQERLQQKIDQVGAEPMREGAPVVDAPEAA
jgi:hypothetical protein